MSHRLQQEIKQTKPFVRIGSELLVSVLRTAAVLDHAIGDVLRPYGVTVTQYNVLRILRGAGKEGLCGREVGERLIAQVPDVPRLLDRMEEQGAIHRERDPVDRRHITARITTRGLHLLDDVQAALDQLEHQRLAGLSPGDLHLVVDALATIRGNK